MQVENSQDVPKFDVKSYLRIATISNKIALRFFYIGSDSSTLKLLGENFSSGLCVKNFELAKKTMVSDEVRTVDVIIVDVPYCVKELMAFHSFLKNRSLESIPVVYNSYHLKEDLKEGKLLKENQMIDDVVDLSNWQFDFYNKVNFLKKIKEHTFIPAKSSANAIFNQSAIKRTLDIAVSVLLIALLFPVFVLIAIAIKLESKGPIFYCANRAGKGFRIFKFYKFRTMVVNADKKIDALTHLNQYNTNKVARFFKIWNDPRITKVGKFLRNTSLDELPQLFNVLKGDMSLVGNRPLPLYEAATLTTNEFVERFMAPAGITGLWQIKKRGKAEMSSEERIELDIFYARKASLLYDFWIMAKTPAALFQKGDV